MLEKDLRSRLIAEFRKIEKPGRFIWAFDSHFKAGFPDLYWKTTAFMTPKHAELKLCKKPKLPADPLTLCTAIQRKIMEQLRAAGADVFVIIGHMPPSGMKTIHVYYGSVPTMVFTYPEAFFDWWRSETV